MAIDNNIPPTVPDQLNRRNEKDEREPGDIQTGNLKGGIVLLGDRYDRNKFALMNDAEFTELLSSIEGVGVNEFFVIYEELKDIIPPGEIDVAFSVNGGPEDIFELLKLAAGYLVKGDVPMASSYLKQVQEYTENLTSFLVTTTPNSHAYLVQTSAQYLKDLNDKFKAVFEYLILLISENITLTEENAALIQEVENLKIRNEELTNTLRRLTAPDPSGFRVEPDLFTIMTTSASALLQSGYVYEVNVKGAIGNVVTTKGTDFSGTVVRANEEGKWFITPDNSVRGKTTYVTFKDQIDTTVMSTENVVFELPLLPPRNPMIIVDEQPFVLVADINETKTSTFTIKNVFAVFKRGDVGTNTATAWKVNVANIIGDAALFTYVIKSQTFNGVEVFGQDQYEAYRANPTAGELKVELAGRLEGEEPKSLHLKDLYGELFVDVKVVNEVPPPPPPSTLPRITLDGKEELGVYGTIGSVRTIQVSAKKVGPEYNEIVSISNDFVWTNSESDFTWEWIGTPTPSAQLDKDGNPNFEIQNVNLYFNGQGNWTLAVYGGPPEQGLYAHQNDPYGGHATLTVSISTSHDRPR